MQYCQVSNEETFPVVVLGNKCDLVEDRKVGEEQIRRVREIAKNVHYFETSAKDSVNIKEAFKTIAE